MIYFIRASAASRVPSQTGHPYPTAGTVVMEALK